MKCKRDNSVELSKSPRHQCKRCGQLWFVGSSAPDCIELHSTKKQSTKKVDKKVKGYLERAEKIYQKWQKKEMFLNALGYHPDYILGIAKLIQLEEKDL